MTPISTFAPDGLGFSSAALGTLGLPHWRVIRAQGRDAASFLHGQLSCDVLHLQTHQARLAAYCSAKGRMLASLVVCKVAEDEIWLICHAQVHAATLKRLSMFVLRAKCRLSDAGDVGGAEGAGGAVQVVGWLGAPPSDEAAVWQALPTWGVVAGSVQKVGRGEVVTAPLVAAKAATPSRAAPRSSRATPTSRTKTSSPARTWSSP
jgi:Aminomethyltransferase folate-binding domain